MKRLISILCCLILCGTMMNISAFAENNDNTDDHIFERAVHNLWEEVKEGMTYDALVETYGPYYPADYYVEAFPEEKTSYDGIYDPEYFDLTTVIIEAEMIDEEDIAHLDYQSEGYFVLTYDNEEEASAVLEKYEERPDADVSFDAYAEIFDTGSGYYQYYNYAAENSGISEMNEKILADYGSVSALPRVVIGVIDSGVNPEHYLLSDRVISCKYDYYDNDSDAADEHGHGSHVAGIIADATLSNVKINAYKITNEKGLTSASRLTKAIDQAVLDGVDIINMSLGGQITYTTDSAGNQVPVASIRNVYKSLDKARAAGIMLIMAAGNYNIDVSEVYPAAYEGGVVISAVDETGNNMADYSDYGAVDLCAPGSNIYSAGIPFSYFTTRRGTSMAAPLVSAAAAMVMTEYPSFSADQTEAYLIANAVDLGTEGYDSQFGYGRLDLSSKAKEPVIKTRGGEYDSYVDVTITWDDKSSHVYYTTDGSEPTEESDLYTGKIQLSSTTCLKAVSIRDGKDNSDIVSETYYFNGECLPDDFMVKDGVITEYTGSQSVIDLGSLSGMDIRGIASLAFYDADELEKIRIPESITYFETGAFGELENLTVYLEGTIDETGDYPFGYDALVHHQDDSSVIDALEKYGYILDSSEISPDPEIVPEDQEEDAEVFAGDNALEPEVFEEEPASEPEAISEEENLTKDTEEYDCSVNGHKAVFYAAKAATCEEAGWEEYYVCAECGYSTYSVIPPTGHILEDIVETVSEIVQEAWDEEYDEISGYYVICNVEGCGQRYYADDEETAVSLWTEHYINDHEELYDDISEGLYSLETETETRIIHHEAIYEDRDEVTGQRCSVCGKCFMPGEEIPEIEGCDSPVFSPEESEEAYQEYTAEPYQEVPIEYSEPEQEISLELSEPVQEAAIEPSESEQEGSIELSGPEQEADLLLSETEEQTQDGCDIHTLVVVYPKDPLCNEAGYTKGLYCSECGMVFVTSETVPANEEHIPRIISGSSQTCKRSGLTRGIICAVCKDVLEQQTVIPVSSIHYKVKDEAVEPTCGDVGYTEGSHCRYCGAILESQEEIPATNLHTLVTDEKREPTCTENGFTEGSHCSVCNKILIAREEIPATGHDYVNGVCEKCGDIHDGFAFVDETWGWYQDGSLMTEMSGVIKGIINDITGWYYIRNGNYDGTAAGLTKRADGSNNVWYYVQDGIFTKATGLAKRADGSNNIWYYVQDGIFTKATGLAKRADGFNNTWYYVSGGVLSRASGLSKRADGSNNSWYYVKNGIFTKSTGIAKRADGSNNIWYYVKNGAFTKETCIAKKADGSGSVEYYVENGVFTKYTGQVTINNVTYTLVNGAVK